MRTNSDRLAKLRAVSAVLLDMDGVLYVGDQALPGVQELLDVLDQSGRKWLCVTNNSSRTSKTFSDKLAGMDITVSPDHILGSAQATANWLAQQAEEGAHVIMMGEESLRAALMDKGFVLVSDPFEAEYAVASIYFGVNYSILSDVSLAIRNGARFIAADPDPTLPTERGQVPGTGSLVALLATSSGTQPEYVGKPYPGMYQQAMQRLGSSPSGTLMVGDRYETDIIGAIELGMPTAGVLTGVTTREQYAVVEKQPDILVEGLPDLLALFREADK